MMLRTQTIALLLPVAFGLEASHGFLVMHKGDPNVVTHDKEAGNGYLPGSPLYDKQEEGSSASDGVDLTCADPKPPAEGGCTPPVSTTMKCVINLAIQYFILYSALAGVRSFCELTGSQLPTISSTLNAACMTVNYAPMLSVLFLGTRMRAVQLSGGQPDKYDLPQPYVKTAMWCATTAVLIQTLVVLVLPLISGGAPKVGKDGAPEMPPSPGIMGTILTILRWVTMIMLYGGFTTVCVGAYAMEAPTEVYPAGTAPPVSPAVACTMNLAMQYFGVYLAIQVVQTWVTFQGTSLETRKLTGILQMATNTVNFAPMLSILFIGARIRALQIDPKFGAPQPWAQNCFYLCAYSVLAQLSLVIVVPYALGGEVRQGSSEGDITFELANPTLFFILSGIRYCLMLALYGGFTAVIVSVFMIEDEENPEKTPPISPAMQCVMNLTAQFFFVYLMLWVLITLRQVAVSYRNMDYEGFFEKAIPTMEAAKGTVQFAPMLSVLFLGLRMRALQITGSQGQPQKWAQDGMFLATYAVLVQMLMVFLTPLFTGGPPKMDEDGNVVSKPGNKYVAYTLTAIRYLALLCLYGGAVACVVALFKITPAAAMRTIENENLVPGVSVPPPANPADTVADAGDAAGSVAGFFF
jgi:hypothetical protein